ncbi:MAG TPA: hypothetical protein VEO91_11875 [Candidatus Limnocylindria bacterium]|nr:hypothetical protein [Candidatus Limnocylindria bacterium]
MTREARRRILHLEVPIDSDDELSALQGALLAARASELSQVRRRGDRLSFGYGTDSAREGMSAEVDQAERRWAMIDRLLEALDEASARNGG